MTQCDILTDNRVSIKSVPYVTGCTFTILALFCIYCFVCVLTGQEYFFRTVLGFRAFRIWGKIWVSKDVERNEKFVSQHPNTAGPSCRYTSLCAAAVAGCGGSAGYLPA